VANVILTSGGLVPAPEPDPPPQGGPPMSEEYTFPRFYFSQAEPNGRQFNTQEELDAAGGPSVWLLTPQAVEEAAKAQLTPPTPTGHQYEGSEGVPPRSRR
jgi:hypothetical protein